MVYTGAPNAFDEIEKTAISMMMAANFKRM